jgi:hypothetical protein
MIRGTKTSDTGLFAFGNDGEQGDEVTGKLTEIIERVLGKPTTESTVHESEMEAVCAQAMTTLIEAFRSHTLADTQPDRPDTLVFATRHRAYFDYLLAQAVLDELISRLEHDRGLNEDFVLWAIEHNIVEHSEHGDAPPFASCLDFVLWHRSTVDRASEVALRYLANATDDMEFSDELASYIISLGLALILRRGQLRGKIALHNIEVSSGRDTTIRVVSDIVPTISHLSIASTSFPSLIIRETNLNDVDFQNVDIRKLEIADSSWRRVRATIDVERILFKGRVELEGCEFDFDGDSDPVIDVEWAPTTRLTLRNCVLRRSMLEVLSQQAALASSTVILKGCTALPELDVVAYSPGRQFVNRLVSLCRKHGHNEYGVFRFKLRGRSVATADSFSDMLAVLARHNVIANTSDAVIKLTSEAEKYRFSGKSIPGQRLFEEVEDFWEPVVS